VGGFALLALQGLIVLFFSSSFFGLGLSGLGKRNWGGGIRVQSLKYLKLGLWKFREVQHVVSLGNS
jgi:hypothetical protein